MDNHELLKHIDHQRWLLNNGMISDKAKNDLYLYGSMLHKEIQAVEIEISTDNKLIAYTVYASDKLMKTLEKYNKLSKSSTIWGLWRFKALLKKNGNLDFNIVLKRFIKASYGPKWSATVNIVHINEYVDGYKNEQEYGQKS